MTVSIHGSTVFRYASASTTPGPKAWGDITRSVLVTAPRTITPTGYFHLGPVFLLSGVTDLPIVANRALLAPLRTPISPIVVPDVIGTLDFLTRSKTTQSLRGAVRREVSKAPLTYAGILEQAATWS